MQKVKGLEETDSSYGGYLPILDLVSYNLP